MPLNLQVTLYNMSQANKAAAPAAPKTLPPAEPAVDVSKPAATWALFSRLWERLRGKTRSSYEQGIASFPPFATTTDNTVSDTANEGSPNNCKPMYRYPAFCFDVLLGPCLEAHT